MVEVNPPERSSSSSSSNVKCLRNTAKKADQLMFLGLDELEQSEDLEPSRLVTIASRFNGNSIISSTEKRNSKEQSADHLSNFGLMGTFKDLLISNEELEQSAKKLEEEELNALKNQYDIALSNLLVYEQIDDEVYGEGIPNVCLSYNFLVISTIQRGTLHMSDNCIKWNGLILKNAVETRVTLKFDYDKLSDVRAKIPEDGTNQMLLFTVDTQYFIQFSFECSGGSVINTLCEDLRQRIFEAATRGKDRQDNICTETSNYLLSWNSKEIVDKVQMSRSILQMKIMQSFDEYTKELLKIQKECSLPTIPSDLDLSKLLPSQLLQLESRISEDCKICYCYNEEIILYPCKHKICSSCYNKLGDRKCPWDRSDIQMTLQLNGDKFEE